MECAFSFEPDRIQEANTQRMKIAFLAGTLGRGGAERQLTFMLRALRNAGIEARVLSLTKGEAFEKEIIDLGFDVEWIGNSENRLARLASLILNIRKRPIDILQSSHFYTNIYVGLAGKVLGVNNIGAIRNDLVSEIAANGKLGKLQLKLPQNLIANSRLAVERAIAGGIDSKKIDFVSNVVEIKNGSTGVGKAVLDKNKISVLFAGRLVQQKRPELFIEMASRLRESQSGTNFEFIIAGSGPLRPELEKKARDHGIDETELIFLGEQPNMNDVYDKADMLVLTSSHEGTPNVILEAMSHALPVVATKVGGVSEVVPEGCGVLVDPNDFEELCKAASTLVQNRELRHSMGHKAQEYVRKNHSIGYLQDKLTSIYAGLLENKGSH
ncbi:MAG: glycosyltransferase [Pyrinomonadaceae bacterium]